MKVKELVTELSKLDQEKEICINHPAGTSFLENMDDFAEIEIFEKLDNYSLV